MLRTDIINAFIDKYKYKSYLEIGLNDGLNFRQINCDDKNGVDPAPAAMGEPVTEFKMTSDDFFKDNKKKYDIIFVDGLHHSDAVYRDIKNSLKYLNEGGTIVCHDMSPINELHQRVPRESQIWNGDCWKAWVQLRAESNDLEMYVVDTDWGCGVIRKGKQTKLELREEVTFENLVINRKKWLNLISIKEFLEKL
jgi:hypothetical protein